MSFVLTVDAPRWRHNLKRVRESVESVGGCALVPVVKGNGYGIGQARLAHEVSILGTTCMAVGTVFEVAEVAPEYAGDILVLEPFEPNDAASMIEWSILFNAPFNGRLIATVSSRHALNELLSRTKGFDIRIVLEGATTMNRFGASEGEVLEMMSTLTDAMTVGRVQLEGLALHLPMATPTPGRVAQTLTWWRLWRDVVSRLPEVIRENSKSADTLWVSHLSPDELAAVRAGAPGTVLRARVGTSLWHGDRKALQASGTVLAVRPFDAATAVGYRQKSGRGTLLIVSGGTSHGVSLTAPSAATNVRQRAGALRNGAQQAAGKTLSPFTWDGKQRYFAEPPHMHISLLWLPRGTVVPAVGEQLPASVRFTVSSFDQVIGFDA